MGKQIQPERPASPVPSCVSMKSNFSMNPPIEFRKGDFSIEQSPIQQERPASPVPSFVSMKSDFSMNPPIEFRKGDFSTEQRDQQERSESEILSGQPVQSHQTDLSSIFCSDEKKESSPKDGKNMNKKELADTLEKSQTLLMQEMKTKLKKKYQMLCEGIGQHENQTLLKDIYTELYITEGGSKGVNEEHEVRQIEMASKRQTTPETPIKCNDIFKPMKQHQNKGVRRNLTKGIAGIGKTVSVQKVILDWAEGKANQDVHFIFPLPFRDLNLKKDQYSLMQLLSHYFPELKEINRIEDGLIRTVFIFDGLDECRLPLDFKNNKKCCDVTEPTSVDVLLTNLIEGNLLPSALLWITTRPAAANRIPPECVDQVTEIRGFNEPQKEEYFRKKISDQNLANKIIKHIKTSRSLHIMCHIPVFCWISATVLESMLNEAKKDEIPKTLTQMYEHFLLIQTSMKNKKYNKSTETSPKELSQSDKDMILKLSKLAFQQLQKGNLIFYEEDLRECGIDVSEASEYSSLCTEIFKEESGLYQEKVFSFVHLSIQEFLAAVHALESCLGKKEHVFPLKVIKQFLLQNDDDDGDDDDDDLHPYDDDGDDDDDDEDMSYDLHIRKERLSDSHWGADMLSDSHWGADRLSDSHWGADRLSVLHWGADRLSDSHWGADRLSVLHRRAVDQALNSETGHLDLFLRFLLGLSLESNQILLRGLLTQTGSTTQSNEETVKRTVEYLSEMIRMESSPERIINLFHCLNELGANSLVEDIQISLRSGTLSETELQPHQCSALAYLLLMSEEVLEEFDMKTYKTSEEGYRRLLPAVKTCNRAILSSCGITEEDCASLVSAVKSNPSHLKELDLGYNQPDDSGVIELSALMEDPQCRLETLKLPGCGITEENCASLVSALKSNPSHLKELDLSNNNLKDTGVKLLSALLKDLECRLETLRLSGCGITEEGGGSLVSALKSKPSHLKELDLSNNVLKDSGVKLLSAMLDDPRCRLETLRLSGCLFKEEGCLSLASTLKSNSSNLKKLDLSDNDLENAGVQLLFTGLKDPNCNLESLRLSFCGVTEEGCDSLASALMSNSCHLRELDLSNNDLGNSGVKRLSSGLGNPHCKLETLRLSGCLVTEEGCASLVSALKSNPSHLKELDLSYNHPGDSGVRLLSAGLEDPHWRLEKLNMDNGGECNLKSGLKKYACDLTLDPNTAFRAFSLSEGNRKVTREIVTPPLYLDHPERFINYGQVMCTQGLSGRCYWEVEISGGIVEIAVAYKGIIRNRGGKGTVVGCDGKSWSICRDGNNKVGVYLDWPAGTLSFYSISSDTLTRIKKFHIKFTEPLYPLFKLYDGKISVTLCQM